MLLLSPTQFEAAFLKGRKFVWNGRAGLKGDEWVWLESGIGKVNTAMTLAAYAQRHRPEQVLLFGIAGAYPGSGLQIGDCALAEKEIQADLGVKDGGMKGMGFPTLTVGTGGLASLQQFPSRFPLDKPFTADLKAKTGLGVVNFLTRDLVSENPSEAKQLSLKWEADLENMEGAAFAQTCLWLGLRGAELRAVSNVAGIRDKTQWRTRQAVEALEAQIAILL